MTTFLLLLSLILNGAAIFAIILLYLRQNRLVEAEKKQERIINEIEEVFSAYLFELKEENDKFLELMTTTKVQNQPGDKETAAPEASDKEPEKGSDHIAQEKQPSQLGKGIAYHAARKAYQQNREQVSPDLDLPEEDIMAVESQENNVEIKQLSFIDQVLYMKKQGLTIEEIARDLDKGKTEIELLLKFRQKTQE
ncbi:hypothetical protein [Mesobacillus selenatarsenatis]|uniref:Coupling factor for flagellin transcription and translation n=1 Tax=Mesobacillus selenatarsenatis (strain DSM 18680 / JCM 14380 / FERM P-15431 / SF-1) TaxID=1321606 RepID=A0A0A8X6M7_MESS1|nr:hypothetical protein [Mesobacillus selenatarsenatis]GAM15578.1 hypothetical protein SAMD00020551_3735 [Mesobacillus selenatarsenatis SF-1]